MTPAQAVAAYAQLPPDLQLRVLADYAHDLTLIARGTYVPQTEDIAQPRRLRLLNEVQHRATGHIRHLLRRSLDRYPDEVLVKTVVAEDDPELLSAFTRALSRCG